MRHLKIGDKLGWLTIIRELHPHNRKRIFVCRCECGNIHITKLTYNPETGYPKSCGCLQKASHCVRCRPIFSPTDKIYLENGTLLKPKNNSKSLEKNMSPQESSQPTEVTPNDKTADLLPLIPLQTDQKQKAVPMSIKVEIHKSQEGFYTIIHTDKNIHTTDNYQEVLDILDDIFKETH